MTHVRTSPDDYPRLSPPAITVHALKENKRPIGYAPWPEPVKPKRTRKPKPPADTP